jgi:hypothetical protein
MTPVSSDADLLHVASQQLGIDAEALMTRYYGSPGDVRLELEEFLRTGRLQPSFAELLRAELSKLAQAPAE